MKVLKLIAAAIVAVGALSNVAMAGQYVNGYYRNNGTYVQPYWRSSPNRSYNDNWSVSPNVNPYTGQVGRLSPTYNDRAPTLCNQVFGCY